MEAKTALRAIGFDESEEKIYLFLLQNGPNPQQAISDKTGILRQTVYDVMKKMESKGYVSTSTVGKRKHYSAVDPKLLLQQLRDKEEQFTQYLPQLEKIKAAGQVTIASNSFIGMAGLKNLVNLTLESSTEILWMDNKELSDKVFRGYYWHNYAKKRFQKKVPIKLLIEPTKKKDWDTDLKVKRETRRHPIVKSMAASYVIFDDKVIIYSLSQDQLIGVFIQNNSINDSLKKIFYKLWNEAH